MCEDQTSHSTARVTVPARPWILTRVWPGGCRWGGTEPPRTFYTRTWSGRAEGEPERVICWRPCPETGSGKLTMVQQIVTHTHTPLGKERTFPPPDCGIGQLLVLADGMWVQVMGPKVPMHLHGWLVLWGSCDHPDSHSPSTVKPRIKPAEQTWAWPEPRTEPSQDKTISRTSANAQTHVCDTYVFVTSYWDFLFLIFFVSPHLRIVFFIDF